MAGDPERQQAEQPVREDYARLEALVAVRPAVLVVDDEAVIRDLAKAFLERQGYQTLVAENGREAVDCLRSEGRRVDVVVLDMSMPGMNGSETLAELRKLRPGLNIIISSGYGEEEAMRPFQGARISGFLQKPYTVQKLAAMVKAALPRCVAARPTGVDYGRNG